MLGRGAAAAGAGLEEARGDQGGREKGAHFPTAGEKLPAARAGPQPFAGNLHCGGPSLLSVPTTPLCLILCACPMKQMGKMASFRPPP